MLKYPTDNSAHPTDDQLHSVINGYPLDSDEIEFVESHLETCGHCQTRAGNLDFDPLARLIQKASHQKSHETPKISAGYELIEEAGRGAAGIVYEARQPGTDRRVALKMLVGGANSKASDLARFKREAQALSRLDHPNVVKIFDVGEQEGVPFLAMEWIDGRSLAEFLKTNTLNYQQAATLVAKLADGMQYVHQQGILHRDLKPQNILVPASAEQSSLKNLNEDSHPKKLKFKSAKICDFGLARFSDPGEFHTRTGETLGTPSYMAPEQIGNQANPVTEKTDVYGLGAILYECLTGRPPFHGNSPLETLKMVVDRDPVAVSALRPNVPKDLEVICHRCLAKNPKDRFATALELQQDLERFVQNRPIVSRPIPVYDRAIRWARRNPWPVTVVCLLLAAVAIVIISQLYHSQKLASQRDEALDQYQASRAAIWKMLDVARNESDFEIPRLQELQTNQAAIALELFESLAQTENTQESLMDLARVQMVLGSGLVAQGQADEGIQHFQRCQKTLQKLFDLSPDNLETLGALISSQVKLAHTLNRQQKTDQAIQILQATLPLAQRLHEQTPDNVGHANLVAWTHHNLGTAYVSANKRQLALKEYESAVQIRELARKNSPDNDELLRFLAESQVSLAVCQMALETGDVGKTYLKAIETFNEIEKRNPDDINTIVSKGVAYLNYSNVLAGKNDGDGAIDACTRGIVAIEKALAANPKQYNAKNYISMLYGNRAVFCSQTQKTRQAVDDWRSAIKFSVVDSTRDFCRRALVRDLLVLSKIDEAISEMENFKTAMTDHEGQFQLATLWSAICNARKSQGATGTKLRSFQETKRILTHLSHQGYFSKKPTAKKSVSTGDEFRQFKILAGPEFVDKL